MSQQPEPSTESASRDSAVMLALLGILAYAASTMTHEALGHGGSCLLAGGHTTMLTIWRQACVFPEAPRLLVKAAGPAAQCIVGLLACLFLHLPALRSTTVRYFLWLCMVFDLFISSSYVAFSGLTNFGDAAELIAGHQPRFAWRCALVLLGGVAYFFAMQLSSLELMRFAGRDSGNARLYRLVWIPYVSAGIFATCAAVLNRTMGVGIAIQLATLSSFGSAAGMFGLPAGTLRFAFVTPTHAAYLRWRPVWAIAAAVVVIVFLLFIGPGLQ